MYKEITVTGFLIYFINVDTVTKMDLNHLNLNQFRKY